MSIRSYDKHQDICPCLSCIHSKRNDATGLRARVTRAFMREWDVSSEKDLPSEVLAAVCVWIGVSAGLFDQADLVNKMIQQGYDAGKREHVRQSGLITVTDDMAGEIRRLTS